MPVDYAGDALEVGFNVSYLLDVMGVLTGATVRMSLSTRRALRLSKKEKRAVIQTQKRCMSLCPCGCKPLLITLC